MSNSTPSERPQDSPKRYPNPNHPSIPGSLLHVQIHVPCLAMLSSNPELSIVVMQTVSQAHPACCQGALPSANSSCSSYVLCHRAGVPTALTGSQIVSTALSVDPVKDLKTKDVGFFVNPTRKL